MKQCEKCKQLTLKYLEQNPDKKGYCLCEDCYEKSKEYYVYSIFAYEVPEMTNKERTENALRSLKRLLKTAPPAMIKLCSKDINVY